MSSDESSRPESSASPKKQTFKCRICKKFLATASKTFTLAQNVILVSNATVSYREANLKRHLLSHTKEKPYKCSVCSFSCSLEQNLKQHMLAKHSEERPSHECSHPDCNFTTPNLSTLKTHMHIHTGEKPFKCSHCDFRSRTSKNIKIHERTHAKERPFKCS
ncbi:hypothetical protein KQX54_016122 [Cotesia glomerata]|uniref:C2H2-type domain-containing protein n=1 Tax=Cotesia glomerata TaxID=32391 RepID=A0AAV7J0K9_COTGL|nr:hypothetical protein KQX54_016122 [Cotesia glomerata]